ncbi:MAG: alanine racemase, partial [Clostridia bacterium]|nr:alanine racemase [Clostridia bacterium]
NRLGIKSIKEFLNILKLTEQNNINILGFYTHFATAFCDTEYMNFQLKNFKRAVKVVKKHCPDILIHAANTPACFVNKNSCFDMVRIGIGMYGYAELPTGVIPPVKITPVLKISAKIIQIYSINAGERVGYGNFFIAPKPMQIGTVSMGYADGLKKANTGGFTAINGQKAQIIGSICMDMFIVNLSGISAKVGDYVYVLNGGEESNAMTIAKQCNTAVSYILTEFNYRRADFILIE